MKRLLIILCIICPTLFIYNLGSRDFWAPDEGDFAEIVTELSTNFIVPHLNNMPYGEKPPLFYYITYASQKALFWLKDEASMRFPTAIFAFLCTIFTCISIRKFFDEEMAMFSVFILITAPLFYWQARYLQADMIFSSFVVSGLLFFLWFYHTGKTYFLYLYFIFTGLAFVTKGPLSIALMFPVVFIFLMLEKNFKAIKPRAIIIGSVIFLLVILPWYITIYLKEGMPYLYENIIRQNLTRFLDAWSHKRPIYYYLTTLPLDFFPWSLFLPSGIYIAFTKFRNDPKVKFFLIWFLWMFVFFSISSGKISKYMLPVLPSISLITSYAFMKKNSKYNLFMFSITSIIILILSVLLFFYKPDIYNEFIAERVLLGSLCLIFAITTFLFLWKKKQIHVYFAIVLFIMSCYTIANTSVYKKLNLYKSPKYMCEKIKNTIIGSTPWVYYGSIRGVYVYYVGKYAIHVDEHMTEKLKHVQDESAQFYILTRKRDMKEVNSTLANVEVIFEEKIGETWMVFAYCKNKETN